MRTSSLGTIVRRALFAAAMVLTLGLSSPAAFAEDPHLASKVDALLDQFETVPSEADWLALGPDAAPLLRQIANDPSQLANRRASAIRALGLFPSTDNRAVLETILDNNQVTDTLRRGALRSLAVAYGDDVVPTLEVYVQHTDYHFRESAVRALSNVGTVRARRVLEKHLNDESSRNLKAMIQGEIRALDDRALAPSTAPQVPVRVNP